MKFNMPGAWKISARTILSLTPRQKFGRFYKCSYEECKGIVHFRRNVWLGINCKKMFV